jgi:hypothetical protein
VKDEQSLHTDEFFPIHYYSPVAEHSQRTDALLFNCEPDNLYLDETKSKKIESYLRLLSRFNVYMDLVIDVDSRSGPIIILLEGQLHKLDS